MRLAISFLFILNSTVTLANPFDGFVGNYTVTEKTAINSDRANWCNRWGLKDLTGIRIETDSNNPSISNLYVSSESNTTGMLTLTELLGDFVCGTNCFSKTDSSALPTRAISSFEQGSSNPNSKEVETVSLSKTATGFEFTLSDSEYDGSNLTASCDYKVNLQKIK